MRTKNDGAWGGLILILLVSFGFSGIYILFGWGEREGVVKYDDCRQVVTLAPDTLQKYYHTFTCTYSKTKSGKIMSGECARIENDNSLFSSSHSCATAYIYEKKQDNICTNPPNIYLGYDDMCYTTPQ